MMSEQGSPFHRGEQEMQTRVGVRDRIERMGQRMIRDHMPEQHQTFFAQLPLILVGSVDAALRPWASVMVGEPGFARALDAHTLEVSARPVYSDPLAKALVKGADIGALGIEFATRRRNRVNGTVIHAEDGRFQLRVAQSFGNCPKYIQTRELKGEPLPNPDGGKRTVNRSDVLTKDQAAMIARADTFFIASQFNERGQGSANGIDVSHRGGKPGVVVVAHESSLLFPDYTGNGMFNTLGNIVANPRSGLLFIDFDGGDVLQLTGEAEVLWDAAHTMRFPGAERVVAFRVEEVLHIERALPHAWQFKDYSPVFDDFEAVEVRATVQSAPAAMKLLSVNVSMPKDIQHAGATVTTSIFKEPAEGRVMLRRLNLDGDGQSDRWGHGGAFRAAYVYSIEYYDYWQRELGREDFIHGQFGENFTVTGMLDDEICVGDVFRVGGALVEVSQPRIPCYKLALKMGIEGFQNRFLESGRIGFYVRVLEEGEVGAGDAFELVSRDPRGLTVRQVSDLLYFDKENLEATRQALSIPALAHGWKGSFEERLAKARAGSGLGRNLRTFIVERKVPESDTITSFYLVPEDGAPLTPFVAGQFLPFELEIAGRPEPVIRTYSLSDSPNEDYYRVSIKREPAPPDQSDAPPGLSSNYFHDQVAIGASLRIGPPRGKFHLDLESERPVVLLSGGVGLTPMISMLNAIAETDSNRPVWFIHGTRNGREHALGDHVRGLARHNSAIHAHIRYSAPHATDVEGRDYDSQGFVDIELLKRLLPFDDYDFYVCGPPPFMKSLYCGLLGLDVSEARIHYEFFGPAAVLKDEAGPCGGAPERSAEEELTGELQVTFARSGMTAAWDPDCETILDLAEKQGLSPPYSCRSGICHTCISEVVEGDVEYLEEPLDPPGPGQALICCARPKSKLVIEL